MRIICGQALLAVDTAFPCHMSLRVHISMGPHSAQPSISSQHTDPLSPEELGATCSPCLKWHFTALAHSGKSTSMSSYLQHLCPSDQQLQAMPGELGTHHVPRELAYCSLLLSTCAELGAGGESVQRLKASCACARGKQGLQRAVHAH